MFKKMGKVLQADFSKCLENAIRNGNVGALNRMCDNLDINWIPKDILNFFDEKYKSAIDQTLMSENMNPELISKMKKLDTDNTIIDLEEFFQVLGSQKPVKNFMSELNHKFYYHLFDQFRKENNTVQILQDSLREAIGAENLSKAYGAFCPELVHCAIWHACVASAFQSYVIQLASDCPSIYTTVGLKLVNSYLPSLIDLFTITDKHRRLVGFYNEMDEAIALLREKRVLYYQKMFKPLTFFAERRESVLQNYQLTSKLIEIIGKIQAEIKFEINNIISGKSNKQFDVIKLEDWSKKYSDIARDARKQGIYIKNSHELFFMFQNALSVNRLLNMLPLNKKNLFENSKGP